MRYFCKKSRFLFFLFLVLILLLGYTLYFDTTGKSKQASIGGDSSLLRSRKSQRSGHTVATVENHQAVKGHNTEKTQISSKANVGEVPVFITVKTGRTYHQTRIPLLLQTWFNYAANEVCLSKETDRQPTYSALSDFDRHILSPTRKTRIFRDNQVVAISFLSMSNREMICCHRSTFDCVWVWRWSSEVRLNA